MTDFGYDAFNRKISETDNANKSTFWEYKPSRLFTKVTAGKIYSDHEANLRARCEECGWRLVTPSELAQGVRRFAKRGYENDVITIVTKLLEQHDRTANYRASRGLVGLAPPVARSPHDRT